MKRARRGAREENEDKLSDLPDDMLLHILAFMDAKHVVQTCVLSKRWKDLWKHVPNLSFDSLQFKSLALFTNFVAKVRSCRDDSTALLKLDFNRRGYVDSQFLNRIVRYAASHNVQQLSLCFSMSYPELPLPIFSCQSLTSLDLPNHRHRAMPLFPKSLNLRALTNLHLENLTFCPSDDGQAEPFSNCKKLHTLVIDNCTVIDAKILCISNAGVATLTMRTDDCIWDNTDKIVLFTPNLRSFVITSFRHQPKELVGSNLPFLEEVYINVKWELCGQSALVLNSWFQVFTDVLYQIPDLRDVQSPCFRHLNSLKVQAGRYKPAVHSEIVNYLLRNSPSAERTIIEQ